MIKNGTSVRIDVASQVLKSIQAFDKLRVLVGVPESTAGREDYEGQEINNATIGYLMENGSPAANIPARPHLVPGVQSAGPEIVKRYRAAAQKTLAGETRALGIAHQVVGQIAADKVRLKIATGPFQPLAPSTVAGRARQRGTGKRPGEIEYARLIRQGETPASAQAAAGIQPLINSGQYSASIIFVVRARGR